LFAKINIYYLFLLISWAQGVSGKNETTCPNTMARCPQRCEAQCSRIGWIGLRPAL